MGELAYDYLAREANGTSDQWFSGWFGYAPPPMDTYGGMGHFPPLSPSGFYATSPDTTYVLALKYLQNPLTPHLRTVPFPVSPSPSPSISQASSTPEHNQVSPEPSPTPEPSCRQATPMFNHIRVKWCCSACHKGFRGKWECKRHITGVGKRAVCLACQGNISGRGDSRRRHFKRYCKGDIGNFRFEEAFIGA